MDWTEAAALDFERTKNARVAWLVSDANPDVNGPNGRDSYRRLLIERYGSPTSTSADPAYPSLVRQLATAAGAITHVIAAVAPGQAVTVATGRPCCGGNPYEHLISPPVEPR